MTKTWTSTLVGLSLLLPGVAFAHGGAGDEAPTVVEGELVDLACYVEHGGKGEKHKPCATSCAESGLPIGLLDKHDKLYLVIGDHKPMNKELADKMGTTVKLKGEVSTRNGMRMIEVSSVQ